MECREIDEQRKEERMRPKMRELHELPSTEIVKSISTDIRLASDRTSPPGVRPLNQRTLDQRAVDQ